MKLSEKEPAVRLDDLNLKGCGFWHRHARRQPDASYHTRRQTEPDMKTVSKSGKHLPIRHRSSTANPFTIGSVSAHYSVTQGRNLPWIGHDQLLSLFQAVDPMQIGIGVAHNAMDDAVRQALTWRHCVHVLEGRVARRNI